MSKYYDPLKLAGKLGQSIGGELGKIAFIEQELALVNSILPRFQDNPLIRMKQHLLFHWGQSFQKSTLINEFSKCIPDQIKKISITSNSPEMLFGTINANGQIIYPLFANVQIATITELSTFIPARNCGEIVNQMNKTLEGEPVERQLLKFGRRSISEEEIKKALDLGVKYDPVLSQLTHVPNVTIIAGSRPLPNRTYTHLKSSGFWYRLHIIQKELTNKDVEKYLKANYSPDFSLYQILKDTNTKIASIKIKKIQTPPDELMNQIIDTLLEYVRECSKCNNRSFVELSDMRTKGDIMREMAAYATIRTLYQNGFKDVEEIIYEKEDKDYIINNIDHFIEAKLNPLYVDDFSVRKKVQRPKEQVKKLILTYLGDLQEKSRRQIDTYIKFRNNACKATVSNALNELVSEEKIESTRHGHYKSAST